MLVRLEHANLCVRDFEAVIGFLTTAFPVFRVRGEGVTGKGTRWLHIGTDETYIALMQARTDTERPRPYTGAAGVNHLAYEIDDADDMRARLLAAGYKESTPPNTHPHRKRVYFYDPEGNDWEFVQYFSDNPAERNDYDTPDS